MKRAAAVIGPTPPFIRWALETACPLIRSVGTASAKRHPAQTAWRQLRGIKEVSQAIAAGRSHAGYCFAPQSTADQVVAVRIDEVTAPLGGTARVEQACRACPANPSAALGQWAACTGLLPLVSPGETVEQTKAAWGLKRAAIEQRAVSVEQRAVSVGQRAVSGSDSSRPAASWYQCWSGPSLGRTAIASARQKLIDVEDLFREQSKELAELLAALELAEQGGLNLWIEPVPAGSSDGQAWLLPAHCRCCGAEWSTQAVGGTCPACGRSGSYQAPRRLKVLGLRPFLQLSQVLGDSVARQLQGEYESTRLPAPGTGQSSIATG